MVQFLYVTLILLSAFSGGVGLFAGFLHLRLSFYVKRGENRAYSAAFGGYGLMILTLAYRILESGSIDLSPAAWTFLLGLTVAALGHTAGLVYIIRRVAEHEEEQTMPPPPPAVREEPPLVEQPFHGDTFEEAGEKE